MQLVKSINKLGLASDIDIPLQKKKRRPYNVIWWKRGGVLYYAATL